MKTIKQIDAEDNVRKNRNQNTSRNTVKSSISTSKPYNTFQLEDFHSMSEYDSGTPSKKPSKPYKPPKSGVKKPSKPSTGGTKQDAGFDGLLLGVETDEVKSPF